MRRRRTGGRTPAPGTPGWRGTCRPGVPPPRKQPRRTLRPSSARHPRAQKGRGPGYGERDDRESAAESQEQRLRVPAGDYEAPEALDEVGDRVRRRDVAEPIRLYEITRQVDARHEDGDEEEREGALDCLDRAGPQGQHRPYPPEAQGHEHREQHEHDHAREARFYVHPEEDPDGQEDHTLYKPQGHDAR